MRFYALLFLFVHQISFAQNEGAGRTNWSNYSTDPCFRQLSVSYMCVGYSKQTGTYFYNIKFKNSGSKNIHFDYDSNLISGERFMHGRFDIGAGQEYVWVSQSFNTPPQSGNNFIRSSVSKFLENAKDDWTLPSFDCNYSTGKWFCSNNCENSNKISNSVSISNQNTTFQTQQQDNYAYTKQADLSEAKRVQEITDKSKTYREYYEKATAAGQAGNYDLAISNWNSAIEVAENDFQRENAQQWLQQVQNAKKNSAGSNTQTYNAIPQPNVQQAPTIDQDAIRAQNIANTAVAVVQLGMVAGEVIKDAQRMKLEKKDFLNKFKGNESLYPEASLEYTKYMKLKKKSKSFMWAGLGVAIGGLAFVNIASRSTFDFDTYNSYYTKIRIGQGIMIGGLGLSLVAIPIKMKANSKLENAKRFVGSLNFKTSEIQLALNF